jgi:hypothetical protein
MGRPAPLPTWDLERAEIIEWQSDDPAFEQDMALEASGLAVLDGILVVPSETYGRLLLIDPEESYEVRVLRLEVPLYAELEGVTVHGHTAYLCDEAYATVHVVDLTLKDSVEPIPTRALPLEGLTVRGGKTGYEGIAITTDGSLLYLLLERSGEEETGCISKVFRMQVTAQTLLAVEDHIEIDLEDCSWRLSALELWQGRLLALKTQYPDKRYELISIDPDTGEWEVVLEMTELLRSVASGGWGNNVEGLAVTADGTIYLVGDNAVTGRVDAPDPPLAEELTLLLRIPVR